MNEVDDRRQRAREAAYDTKDFSPYVRPGAEAVESAIEVATRVKLTPEMVRTVHEEVPGALYGDVVNVIRRFCAVAGLEVID